MRCLAQWFCKHEYKHRFIVKLDGGHSIKCYCWKCEKTKVPDRIMPIEGDEVLGELKWEQLGGLIRVHL